MPSPYNISNIPAPRVDFIDPRTGLMAREWYRFFFNLFNLTGGGTTDTSLADLQVGPPAINEVLGQLGITYDQAQLAAMMAQYEQATRDIQNQLENSPALPQLGTLSAINEDNVRMLGFSQAPSPTPNDAPGVTYWDDGSGTLVLGLKGGNVTYFTGQQEFARCYNDTALSMTKGQVVYISGAQGNRIAVKLAQADSDANSAHTIGFVAETIAAGGEGWVQVSGPMYKLNTTGTTAGDTVYLSPTVAGTWTTTKPVAPEHLVIVGFIERVSATVGSIYIKVDNGYELDELHNVKITSVANGDLLQYDSTGPFWKNVAISSLSIGTATNLAGGGAGSVPYQSAASTTTFLPIGTASQVLKVNAGATAPEWVSGAALTKVDDTNVTLTLGGTPASALLAATSLTLGWTGQLAATRGGTGQGTYTLGDTLYSSAANTLSKLAGNTTTTRQFLRQTGTGTVSAAPAWDTVTKTDVGLSNVENTALSTWAGSTNLTTLGTIASGTWQGSVIASTYGGTGVNNAGRTLTVNTNSGTLSFTNASTTLTIANTGSISGTNTGDQTITLTGDVTGSGTGSFATTIAAASTGTGNLVRATSPTIATPTITTSATVPLVIGGTGTTSTLTLRATSGVGTTGSDIIFQVGNNGATEAMRVISTGSVGIGTTNPGGTLEVSNDATAINLVVRGSSGIASGIVGRSSRGTLSAPTATLAGDNLSYWGAGGYNSTTGFTSAKAQIIGQAAENFTSAAQGTDLIISTTNIGTVLATEKVRVTSEGAMNVAGRICSTTTNYPNFAYNSAYRICFGETVPPPNDTTNSFVCYGSTDPARGMAFAITRTGAHTSFFGDDGGNMILGAESTGPIIFKQNLNYNAVDVLASGTERMRIDSTGNVGIGTAAPATLLDVAGVVSANGVKFPAVQVASADANTLDDYEEGTFTPTIVGGTTAGTGTYTIQVGRYTKVGRNVTFTLYVNWTAHTGTGVPRVSGLPFTSANVTNSMASVSIGYFNNFTLTAATVPMAYVQPNTNQIYIWQMPSGGGAMTNPAFDIAAGIMMSGTYTV